jgi:hypothetical protein
LTGLRALRIFWFVVAIAFGLTAGLLIGWMVVPGPPGGTTLEALRADYRTDLVLMTAEIFQQDGDLSAAAARLIDIDPGRSPLRAVQQAIVAGQELGYAQSDIETLARLFQALQTWAPTPVSSQP